jgi:hypothetical protein
MVKPLSDKISKKDSLCALKKVNLAEQIKVKKVHKAKQIKRKKYNKKGRKCAYTKEDFIKACEQFREDLMAFERYPNPSHEIYRKIAKKINDGSVISAKMVYTRFQKDQWGTGKYFNN